jgi:hypothetical protein
MSIALIAAGSQATAMVPSRKFSEQIVVSGQKAEGQRQLSHAGASSGGSIKTPAASYSLGDTGECPGIPTITHMAQPRF